jgi:hypothetical protein
MLKESLSGPSALALLVCLHPLPYAHDEMAAALTYAVRTAAARPQTVTADPYPRAVPAKGFRCLLPPVLSWPPALHVGP